MTKFELWYPIKPYLLTQGFGESLIDYSKPPYNIPSGKHNGWDMVGSFGQACRAAHDGVVTFAGEDGSGGLGIVIRTKEQYWYNDKWVFFKTIYWHLKKDSIVVTAGQEVKVGDKIAECDNTGASSGSHLHFGLKPITQGEQDWQWYNLEADNGYYGAIDPKPFFNNYYAQDAQWVISTMQKMIELLKVVLGLLTKK